MLTPARRVQHLLRRGFLADRRGVSAVEFAFCAPVMILLLVGSVDVTRYVIATEKIDDVATTISQMLSQNTQGTVNYVDLQFVHDSAMVIFPQVLSDALQQNKAWSDDIGISMSSVQFTTSQTNCGTNCTYVPTMMWSGGTTPRSCVVPLVAASNTDPPSPTTLPQDAFGPGSLLITDVSFTFRPTIAGSILPNMNIKRSYFIAPRYVPAIKYSKISSDNGIATACPGFS